MKALPLALVAIAQLSLAATAAEPKRLLLVTTTAAFRHPSIDVAEKTLRDLAQASGDFVVISTTDSPDYPKYSAPQPWELLGGAGARPGGPGGPGNRPGPGGPGGPPGPDFQPPTEVLKKFDKNGDGKLDETERAALVAERRAFRGGPPPGFGGNPEHLEPVRKVLAAALSREALSRYDGVFFLHTTGQLPIPDLPGFLEWVKAGHGILGSHAASDCFHESDRPGEPHSFIRMLGGEFAGHGAQETVVMQNEDRTHPANLALSTTFQARDEMYLFKNYDRSTVHSLLSMTEHPNQKNPGHYPVSWCKAYGSGRIFYTSLGHRHDIWDPAWKGTDGLRTNDPEVAEAFRKHLLGGIRWALGLVPGESQPQTAK